MMCEKCWADAFTRAHVDGVSQVESYETLIAERRDNPCTPREQAGQFWNEALQRDERESLHSPRTTR